MNYKLFGGTMRRIVLVLLCCWSLTASAAVEDASVTALKAKIKIADTKLTSFKGFLVTRPGTPLVVQKEGLSVSWAGDFRRTTRLKNGEVVSAAGTRPLRIGESVFLYKVEATTTILLLNIVTVENYDSVKPGHGDQRLEFAYDNPLVQVGTEKVLEDVGRWLKTEAESSVARTSVQPPPPPALSAQASSPAPIPEDPGLTNDGIVSLVKADLGDEIVIAKLKNAPKVTFDLSTEAIQALKKAKVSSPIIAAMIERDATQQQAAPPKTASAAAAPTPAPQGPCAGVELMGVFKEDMRPVSPLIIYMAKIRNGTNVTRMVTLQWLNMYAEELQSSVEIGAGQIATLKLAAQEPFQRQPINLKLSSCR